MICTPALHTKLLFSDIKQPSGSFRKDINGLRAIAVLAVIINHLNPELLPSGYLGVDIFFVISGFVITQSLERRLNTYRLKDFILDFYQRRIIRILPALIVYILIASVFSCIFILNQSFARAGAFSILGMSNLYFIRQSSDYFASSSDLNPFLQTWSLGIEEQFYFVFPLLFWILIKSFNKISYAKRIFICAIAVSMACMFSYINLIANYSSNFSYAYFSPLTRFWEIGIGCFAAFTLGFNIPDVQRKAKSLLGSILFLTILCLCCLKVQFSPLLLLAATLSTALLIRLNSDSSFTRKLLENRAVQVIGLTSYSSYLWHWGIIVAFRWTIGINKFTIPPIIFMTAVATFLSFAFVEQGFQNLLSKTVRLRITLASGLFAALFSPLLNMFFQNIESGTSTYSKKQLYMPSIRNTEISLSNCKLQTVESLQVCSVPPIYPQKRSLLLIGDSHAAYLYPLAERLREQYGFGINSYIAGANPPAQLFPSLLYQGEGMTMQLHYNIKKYQTMAFKKFINEASPGSLVIVMTRLGAHFDEYKERKYVSIHDNITKILTSPLKNYLSKLDSISQIAVQKQIQVVLIGPLPMIDLPTMDFCMPNLLRNEYVAKLNCSKALKRYTDLDKDLQKLSALYTSFSYVKAVDPACEANSSCDVREMYVDTNHPSPKYALRFIQSILKYLN